MFGFLRASASIIAVAVAAAALIAGPLVIPSVSTTNTAHVEALWKDYIVAQKRLQFDLARLLSDDWSDFQGVADLQRDHEFAMIELRDMRFQYLLVFDPDRLVYKDGLDGFIHLFVAEGSLAVAVGQPHGDAFGGGAHLLAAVFLLQALLMIV